MAYERRRCTYRIILANSLRNFGKNPSDEEGGRLIRASVRKSRTFENSWLYNSVFADPHVGLFPRGITDWVGSHVYRCVILSDIAELNTNQHNIINHCIN